MRCPTAWITCVTECFLHVKKLYHEFTCLSRELPAVEATPTLGYRFIFKEDAALQFAPAGQQSGGFQNGSGVLDCRPAQAKGDFPSITQDTASHGGPARGIDLALEDGPGPEKLGLPQLPVELQHPLPQATR